MKRKIAIILFLVIIIGMVSACEKDNAATYNDEINDFDGFENTEYNAETDNQYYFSAESQIVAVSNGYYMTGTDKLFYMDKGDMKPVPVCTRVDCSHDTVDCDAYIDTVSSLCYYKGYLYYAECIIGEAQIDESLYRRSLDGSVSEKVCDLVSGSEFMLSEICIHRGYMYYSVVDKENHCTLYRLNMDNYKQNEVFSYEAFDADLYRFVGYGDGILFLAGYALDEDYTGYGFKLYYYDSANNCVELVKDDFYNNYTVAENKIYHLGAGGVYCYDTESGEDSLFYETDEQLFLSYDGKYLYLDNYSMLSFELINESERNVYVVDMDGNLVDTVKLNRFMSCFGDRDYMFVFDEDGLIYFDKSKFGTGENKAISLVLQ